MLFHKKRLTGLCLITLCLAIRFSFAQSDSLSPYAKKIIALSKKIEEQNKIVGQLDPKSMYSLPIGINKEIGSTKYIIAIDSGCFRSNGAFFNAYMAVEFPGSTSTLAFAAQNVWFNPKGVGGGPFTRLVLVSDFNIDISSDIRLHLKPDPMNYIEWDCNGFKSISLKGFFEFGKDLLYPDSSVTSEKTVKASFQFTATDLHDFVADVSVTPFCIQGLKDFSFTVQHAGIDQSEVSNLPGMSFPNGYARTCGTNPVLWTGFFLRDLKVKLPQELSRNNKRIEIDVNSFLIDNTGVSGNISVSNLFPIEEGNMSGWPFSVDQFAINFISNQINGGSLSGAFHLPFMDDGVSLKYSANMYHDQLNHEVDYSFLIQPQKNINFSAFGANIDLYNSSTLAVQKKGGRLIPFAVLNGAILVSTESVTLPSLKFEKLTITSSSPYITGGIFGLSGTGPMHVGGFIASLDSIRLVINKLNPELDISATIGFLDPGDYGFSASTTARVIGKIEEVHESKSPVVKTRWSMDKTAIADIALDIQTQPYRITGGVSYKQADPVYGQGFFGGLSFELKAEPAEFAFSVNAGFGNKANLRYWYVDGVVSTAIPLGTLAEIKRLMGGMYYHMKPTTGIKNLTALLYSNSGSKVPINYTPDASAGYGFRAGAAFASSSSEKIFNGDVLLDIELNSNGGLSSITLDGDVVSMTSISERKNIPISKQKIYGGMHMQYDNTNKSFHAVFDANINAYGVITGSGQAIIHFDPHKWYVCVGRPSNPVSITIADLATAHAYFMAGDDLEPMPPPPYLVRTILGNLPVRNLSALKGGSGLAAGMNFAIYKADQFGIKSANVYYSISFVMGFDLNGGYQGHNGVEPLLGALSIKVTGNRFSDYELLNGTGVAV